MDGCTKLVYLRRGYVPPIAAVICVRASYLLSTFYSGTFGTVICMENPILSRRVGRVFYYQWWVYTAVYRVLYPSSAVLHHWFSLTLKAVCDHIFCTTGVSYIVRIIIRTGALLSGGVLLIVVLVLCRWVEERFFNVNSTNTHHTQPVVFSYFHDNLVTFCSELE